MTAAVVGLGRMGAGIAARLADAGVLGGAWDLRLPEAVPGPVMPVGQMAQVCEEFGISRKTGYKIFDRYKDTGVRGLTDRSRRPHRHANQLPMAVEKLLGLPHIDTLVHRDQLLGHQLLDGLDRVFGKAHVAVRDNTDEPAIVARDDRNTRNRLPVHDRKRIGQRLVRMDRDRVHDHAGFEPLDLADLIGLLFGFQIFVNDPEPASLGQRDRHLGFGHRVHGR